MHYTRLDQVISAADGISDSENNSEPLECVGYRRNLCKTVLFNLWSVLNLGFPILLIHWRPEWGLWWRHSRCLLADADSVLLKHGRGQYSVAKIHRRGMSKCPSEFADFIVPLSSNANNDRTHLTSSLGLFYRYFEYQHVKYVWNQRLSVFQKLTGYDKNVTCSEFYERFKGYTKEEQMQRSVIFGKNDINIDVKSYGKLLVEEILNPFYIFQIFSIALWSVDEYYYFAGCIFVVSVVSISVSLYKTRKQSETLHSMVASSTASQVLVLQKDCAVEVPASTLVPGDVIVIPSTGCVMVCDAVLLAGNCIVNESMLTGESVPVTKTPLMFQDCEVFSTEIHKRHTLFSGTRVIQTRYYGSSRVMAVVVRTGFNTAKGELICSILYPKPLDFKFYRDSMKFIGVLAAVAALGMIYGAVIFILGKASVAFLITRVLDVVTIAVPPSLPAAITVGSVHAQNRLRKKHIFCISPPRINICGKLKLFCFDKTGTLTEEGLDFWCALPAAGGRFEAVVMNVLELSSHSPFLATMAACHSLTMIGGELTGDPLDIKMFEATKWEMEEPGIETTRYDQLAPMVVRPPLIPCRRSRPSTSGTSYAQEVLLETESDQRRFDILVPTIVKPVTMDTYIDTSGLFSEEGVAETAFKVPYEIGIVRQFPFSSNLQMMSVVARTLGNSYMDLYVKGAPEKIVSLCKTSTVPSDVNHWLHGYAVQGFRVIALAWRELDCKLTWHQVQRAKREQMEMDLTFLGLVVMQNALKPETTPVIRALTEAKIRSVMITGDNMHTAISVARKCFMVPMEHRIIILKAYPPEEERPARIEWQATELVPFETDNVDGSVGIPVDENFSFYHFATDGKSFGVTRQYFPDILPKLAIRGTIFARMAPEQKTQLVELLQNQGYIVGMCGDGANDCGALKAAHVGISLSDAEASVAAPFTSKIQNIECVPTLILEGRCALVTSFTVFKYMALYSIIQFVSVLILYTYHVNLADTQFLYIDLVITTTIAVLMGYTAAHHVLVPSRPNGTLFGPAVLTSVFAQILLAVAIQLGAFFYLLEQPWFVPVVPQPNTKFTVCYEESVIFCISSFQYLVVAVAFSKGRPFRKPLYTNIPLLFTFVLLTAFSILLLVYPGKTLRDFFEIIEYPKWEGMQFQLILIAFPVGHLMCSLLIELFVSTRVFKKISHVVTCKNKPKNLYKTLDRELQEAREWPHVGQVVERS